MIYPKNKYYNVFKTVVTIGVPLSVLVVAVATSLRPYSMDVYSYEDGLVENLSALALIVASFIWLIYAGVQVKNKSWKIIFISLIMAGVFFIIGIEEISWGQRILSVESSDFFLENNWQGEMNLHNLNTDISKTLYYSGGVLVLVLLPFFTDSIAKLFTKIKLKWMNMFLPSKWLFLPMAVILSLVGNQTVNIRFVLFTTVFAVVRILYYVAKNINKRHYLKAATCGFLVMIFTYSVFIFTQTLINSESLGIRPWMYSEYFEMYIALGLLIYTIDFIFRRSSANLIDIKNER